MAVKASAAITVSIERDIQGTWRFYRIASSSSSPSVPTEAQGKSFVDSGTVPSGWSKVEPAYDGTSTNSLYTVDLTAFTDGSVVWSGVSKSSSYEAAKQAYNEAVNAKKTATNYLAELSNGVFVHADGTPADPTNTNAKGVRITDDIDVIRSGVSIAKFGDSARIGSVSGGRTEITENGLDVYANGVGTPLLQARAGYVKIGGSWTGLTLTEYEDSLFGDLHGEIHYGLSVLHDAPAVRFSSSSLLGSGPGVSLSSGYDTDVSGGDAAVHVSQSTVSGKQGRILLYGAAGIYVDAYASSGTDYELKTAITELNWSGVTSEY